MPDYSTRRAGNDAPFFVTKGFTTAACPIIIGAFRQILDNHSIQGGYVHMFKRLAIASFIVFMFAAGATVTSAQWRNLGTKEVTDRAEEDTFHISSARGQFRKLRFRVGRYPVRIQRMEVNYASGEKDEIPVRRLIGANRYSRIIDLEDRNRFISNVKFWWDAAGLGRRSSTVTLFGLR